MASECQGWNTGDVCGKHQVCSRWSSVQPTSAEDEESGTGSEDELTDISSDDMKCL